MNKTLLLLLLLPFYALAQQPIIYPGGFVPGNTRFTFSTTDSLTHYVIGFPVKIDTTSSGIWQIGKTLKPVFSNDTTAVRGIMTDTLHNYPHNANNYFLLKIGTIYNCIVDIWHKYNTRNPNAGGIVEFSTDTGTTWMNVINCPMLGIQNFYTVADTLYSGQPAFKGTSSGEQLSRVQFLNCMAIRTTSTVCFPNYSYSGSLWLRFRFVSDSTVDSLSGWMIDSLEVEYPGCGAGVKNVVTNEHITIYPNPVNATLIVSAISGGSQAADRISQITITNLLGQTLLNRNYNSEQVELDVADLPSGMYMVRINGSEVRKFVKE